MTRSIVDPTNQSAINQITGWLDASMVYGSDQATLDSLRLADGHMKTSAGGNLPIDPASGLPMAGDVRAAENPGLTALQTLFVREHNYQVDQLALQHPDWTGDHLYQEARAIVGAEIAHITYDEFLPKLLGENFLTPYQGFDPTADPRITEEFAGAAYRFGHSIVSDDTERVDNLGVSSGEIELQHAFFMKAADFNSARRCRWLPAASRRRSGAGDGRPHCRWSAQLPGRSPGRHGPRRDQHPARPRSRARHPERDPRSTAPDALYQRSNS